MTSKKKTLKNRNLCQRQLFPDAASRGYKAIARKFVEGIGGAIDVGGVRFPARKIGKVPGMQQDALMLNGDAKAAVRYICLDSQGHIVNVTSINCDVLVKWAGEQYVAIAPHDILI